MEWDNCKGGVYTQRKQNIVNTTRVLGTEGRYDESWLGKCMAEGRKDGAVEASTGSDAVDGKLDGKGVFDCALRQLLRLV